MAYDPHGRNDTQYLQQEKSIDFFGIGDYYKAKYTAYPGTWSGSEGIATPFGFSPTRESFEKFAGMVSKSYREKGAWGAATTARRNFKDMIQAGGGRVLGFNKYRDSVRQAQAAYDQARAALKGARLDKLALRKTAAFMGRAQPSVISVTPEGVAIPGKPLNLFKQADDAVTAAMKTRTAARTTLKGLTAQAGARKLGRFAIRGARAFSYIGAALMFADIAMAVTAPLGRALVEQTNATMERFENRFMPELGGKLNAAYLSYGAATERQRAVQAISKAHINGRSAYGQEASLMHS